MSFAVGFRKADVHLAVPANTLTSVGLERGEVLYAEVTNGTASTIHLTVNSYPQQGTAGYTIPIPANSTRNIPMAIYNFQADGVIDFVGYGM